MKETSNDIIIKDVVKNIFSHGGGGPAFLIDRIVSDKNLFEQLFLLIFSDDPKMAWRSCWIIDTASEKHPELLLGKIPEIINGLLITQNGSLKRHFARILCRYHIQDEYLTTMIDRGFELLSPAERAAVRVNAMQLLFNIAQRVPDLKGELRSVIEGLIDEGGSVGFINRANKLYRKLRP